MRVSGSGVRLRVRERVSHRGGKRKCFTRTETAGGSGRVVSRDPEDVRARVVGDGGSARIRQSRASGSATRARLPIWAIRAARAPPRHQMPREAHQHTRRKCQHTLPRSTRRVVWPHTCARVNATSTRARASHSGIAVPKAARLREHGRSRAYLRA
jgi:hypothetical protein